MSFVDYLQFYGPDIAYFLIGGGIFEAGTLLVRSAFRKHAKR